MFNNISTKIYLVVIGILIIVLMFYIIRVSKLEKKDIKQNNEIIELLDSNKSLTITIESLENSHKKELEVFETKRKLDKSICDINTKIITIEKTIEYQLTSVDIKYELISKYQDERFKLILERDNIIKEQNEIENNSNICSD